MNRPLWDNTLAVFLAVLAALIVGAILGWLTADWVVLPT
jgi:hypothetical protein